MNEYIIFADIGRAVVIFVACFVAGYLYVRLTNKQDDLKTFFKKNNVLTVLLVSFLISIPAADSKISMFILTIVYGVCLYTLFVFDKEKK